MSIILQYIVPLGFLLYYLTKSKRALVYVCMVPILYCFGEAIYLPTWNLFIKMPLGPIELDRHDVGFIILIGVWFYVRQKRPIDNKVTTGLDTISAWILLVLYVAQPIAIAISQGYFYKATIVNNKTYYILPLSIIIWSDLLHRFTREEIWELLNAIVISTVLLSVLYILYSIGLPIYPQAAAVVISFGGQEIARDYVTFPYWTLFSFSFFTALFITSKIAPYKLIYLFVLLAGMAVSLSRGILIMAVIGCVFTTILLLLRLRSINLSSYRAVVFLVAILVSYFLINTFFPTNIGAYHERFSGGYERLISDPNLTSRIDALYLANDIIESVDPVFGLGGPGVRNENVNCLELLRMMGISFADSMWFHLLLITGWSGIVLLAFVLIVNLWNSIKLIFSSNLYSSQIGFTACMFLIWELASAS